MLDNCGLFPCGPCYTSWWSGWDLEELPWHGHLLFSGKQQNEGEVPLAGGNTGTRSLAFLRSNIMPGMRTPREITLLARSLGRE